jgi:hypothetical protein
MPTVQFQGSAKSLRGTIYSLSIFISEEGNPFSQNKKQAILAKGKIAKDWLCKESERYDIPLSFKNGGTFGLNKDVVVDYIPSCDGLKNFYRNWVPFLLNKLGWKDPLRLYEKIKSEDDYDGIHVEIYANKSGRSYALPFKTGLNKNHYYLEAYLCYQVFSCRTEILPDVIAHEMLHLYGAWDLFQNHSVNAKQDQFAKIHFKNDIMRRASANINDLEIGALTAWRIGWIPMREPWYEFFRPKGY